jgi:transglutaminase-like putative cysteine protease
VESRPLTGYAACNAFDPFKTMLIQCGYDIEFFTPASTMVLALLRVHPSGQHNVRGSDKIVVEGGRVVDEFPDAFGNLAVRILSNPGILHLSTRMIVEATGREDEIKWDAIQHPLEELPPETLLYLMSSRYCEVDLLTPLAWELFGYLAPGWSRVLGILNWVHNKVEFGYRFARPTKTALDVLNERTGVCRDYQHLAITFCRAMGIPARYVSGYLGDIGVPLSDTPMDFSAWFEVYLEGQWRTMDARHNRPRIGRILMTTGRDATDVAITTAFGSAPLRRFEVITDEIKT